MYTNTSHTFTSHHTFTSLGHLTLIIHIVFSICFVGPVCSVCLYFSIYIFVFSSLQLCIFIVFNLILSFPLLLGC